MSELFELTKWIRMDTELQIGQKVKLKSTKEVGIVTWLWKDEHGDTDAYVAFFGKKFPRGVPKEKPYVLRYYASSLIALE